MTLKEQLIIDEGLRLDLYLCPKGKRTIGVGRNIDDNPLTEDEIKVIGTANPKHITVEQAMYLLDNDIKKTTDSLISKLQWVVDLPKTIIDVLINMAFNMGVNRLLKFKNMLKAMKEGRWSDAADQMVDSDWYGQVGNRARRLEAIVRQK